MKVRMKRSMIYLSALALILMMAACGTVGKDFSSDKVQNIQKNVTTQSEVLDWFGIPFKEGLENNHVMWTYQYDQWNAFSDTQSKDLVLLFDNNNIVKAYRFTSSLDE